MRGGYIITVTGALLTAWLVNGWFFNSGTVFKLLAWPLSLFALACAGYTALLFGQCKGRDFWQSPTLILHMLNHAPLAGFVVMALAGREVRWPLAVFALLNLGIICAEIWGKHPNDDSAATAKDIRSGRAGKLFYCGVIGIGGLLPLALIAAGFAWAAAVAIVIGLAITEYLWVYTPQKRPNT